MPYKDPEARRRNAREYARKRYQSDPEYREKIKRQWRERRRAQYHGDEEFRKRILAEKKERYRNDPKWREDMLRRARESNSRKRAIRTADKTERLARQNGLCLLCRRPLALSDAHEDHDHSCCSGKRGCEKCVRGLLHGNCNTMIGLAHEDADVLRLGADYVERCHSSSRVERA